jgi:ABC-type transport system involved in multi-copper enzyme maturation permease subunit
MIGPVLSQEMLIGSRRNRVHVFRWLYAGWLILQLLWFYFQQSVFHVAGIDESPVIARVATRFLALFVAQQMILLTLITPTLAAGAITDEKNRGTLQYLLTTDLSSWHIIIGKLLARCAQVVLLALAGLPILCFIGVFGGLEPFALLVFCLVTLLPLVALGSATLLASVWTRQTRDAVLGLYVVGGLSYALIRWVGGFWHLFDPLYVLEPAWGVVDAAAVKEVGRRLLLATLCWGGIGATCLALAIWRLRPSYLRQLEGEGKAKKSHWWRIERAPVGDSPIQWKERHVEGLSPITFLRRNPRWMGVAFVLLATVASSGLILWYHLAQGATLESQFQKLIRLDIDGVRRNFLMAEDGFQIQGVVVMLLASLVVGIRCSGAISGEREKQTWEALLLTPLSSRQLILGKLWGIMGASYIYLAAYAVPAVGLSILAGVASAFWTVIWLSVTLLAMYFIGATGIRCSVRAKSSWRSLLGTVGIGYVGGFFVYVFTTPVVLILALILMLSITLLEKLLQISLISSAFGANFFFSFLVSSCVGLALMFWLLAKFFLSTAHKWVSNRERTRHWKEEPEYYQPRRRKASRRA